MEMSNYLTKVVIILIFIIRPSEIDDFATNHLSLLTHISYEARPQSFHLEGGKL